MNTPQQIRQAFQNLYALARKAAVDADTGDVRETSAKILDEALADKFPLEEEKKVHSVAKKAS